MLIKYMVVHTDEEFECPCCGEYVGNGDTAFEDNELGTVSCSRRCASYQHEKIRDRWTGIYA